MSSGGMPELGSKISLISKADIRYEGRLFTVDPQECTIALANVKSFGTEDRETSYPIMPQPTVYDYILFRGSDIKDIRVVNNVAIPNDPAIMQMHMPQQPGFPQQGFPPMQHGGVPQMGNFGPFGQMQAAMGGPNMPQQQQQQQAQSPIQPQHPDSRSGTPQNARKSPTSDMGVQTRENRENQSGGANKERNQRNNNQRNNNQQGQQRERRDSGQENKGGYRNQNQRPVNNNNQQQPQQQQQRGGYNNNNRNNQQGGQNQPQGGQQQMRRNNQGGSARMGGGPPMNNYRQHNNQGTPNQNQNQNQNKPSNNGPQQQQQARNPRPSHQLKFENEFDFEGANVKFEELRTQLQRLKVGVEEVKPDQVNGEIEKKDDSGNETGADQEASEHDDHAYDKNKSFFDNISCEAVERSKGKTPRTDWRQERKINSETFGYSFNRRGMNYRGQGRNNYQNRYPRQNYNRGPHQQNNNYRPIRNHRNQNNAGERNNAPNPGQQSQNQAAPVAAN